jgi:hypothetical protein
MHFIEYIPKIFAFLNLPVLEFLNYLWGLGTVYTLDLSKKILISSTSTTLAGILEQSIGGLEPSRNRVVVPARQCWNFFNNLWRIATQ